MAAKKAVKAHPVVREFIQARHDLTHDEQQEMTQKLVQAMNQVEEAEEAAKATSADFKARAKAAKSQQGMLKNILANGYEMRSVECTVEFNRKKGVKTYYLHAPGKQGHGGVVEKKEMTEADYQRLPMDETPPAPAADAEAKPPLNPVLPAEMQPDLAERN